MNASIKLLLIVREPVTRAISDYTQLRSHAAATGTSTSSTMGENLLAITTAATGGGISGQRQQQLAVSHPLNLVLSSRILLREPDAQLSLQDNSLDNSNVNNYNENGGDAGDVGDAGAKLNAINVNSNNNYPTFPTMANINLSNSSIMVTTPATSK